MIWLIPKENYRQSNPFKCIKCIQELFRVLIHLHERVIRLYVMISFEIKWCISCMSIKCTNSMRVCISYNHIKQISVLYLFCC